jgi:hypothetical protein
MQITGIMARNNRSLPINLFSARIKTFWALTNLLLAIAEVIAIGPMPVYLYCLYYGAKVFAFLVLGFLSPLAFHRLNGLGFGVLISFTCAGMIEGLQTVIHNGHSFHWYELTGKMLLIILGFALGLERRYERRVSFGRFAIQLAVN